jgi:hypothetical protein
MLRRVVLSIQRVVRAVAFRQPVLGAAVISAGIVYAANTSPFMAAAALSGMILAAGAAINDELKKKKQHQHTTAKITPVILAAATAKQTPKEMEVSKRLAIKLTALYPARRGSRYSEQFTNRALEQEFGESSLMSLCEFMRLHHIYLFGSTIVQAALGDQATFEANDLDFAVPDYTTATLLAFFFQNRGYRIAEEGWGSYDSFAALRLWPSVELMPPIDIVVVQTYSLTRLWPLEFQANLYDGRFTALSHPAAIENKQSSTFTPLSAVRYRTEYATLECEMLAKWEARGFDIGLNLKQKVQRRHIEDHMKKKEH